MVDRATILAELRQKLAATAPPIVEGGLVPCGIPSLDVLVDGWPRPGISAIVGGVGSGRLGWVIPAMRRLTAEDRHVAVVDPNGWLNPPGLPGVRLERLILVRPGAAQSLWAAEQLCRCGALGLVLLLDPPPLGRAGRRLRHAVEAGRSALVVLSDRVDPDLNASLRLETTGPGTARLARGPVTGRVVAMDETGEGASWEM